MSEIQVVANSVTPTPPPAGYLALYAKSDGLWYVQDSAGAETLVGPVTSVAGKVGVVTLVKADVGLGLVDNTSDANKPVSTAQQAALDLKLNAALREAVNGVAGLDANLEVIKPQAGAGQEVTAGRPYSVKLADGTWGVGISNGGIGNVNDPLVHIPFRRANDEVRLSGTQTFIRASTGTYIDPLDGLIKTAAIDTPRFERMADGGVGILLEGASTNYCLYSQDFSNAVWNKYNSTVTINTTTSPDGTLSADTLTDNTASGTHAIGQLGIIPAGAQTTYAILQAGTSQYASVQVYNLTDTSVAQATFDLVNGTVVSTTSGTAKISPMANGFYKCEVSGTGTVVSDVYVYINNGSSVIFTGTGSGTINIWHMQGENLPFASSYIPTTTAAVTRAADNLTLALSGNYPGAKGMSIIADAEFSILSGEDNIYRINEAGAYHWLRRLNNAVSVATGGNTAGTSLSGIAANTVHRIGMVVDSTTITATLDGVMGTPTTNVGTSIPTTAIAIGLFSQRLHVRNFRIYDRALTASEIAAA